MPPDPSPADAASELLRLSEAEKAAWRNYDAIVSIRAPCDDKHEASVYFASAANDFAIFARNHAPALAAAYLEQARELTAVKAELATEKHHWIDDDRDLTALTVENERLCERVAGLVIGKVSGWRCFHCNETFTEAQEKHAREHFGRDESETPVCIMRVPGENGLIAALRKAQDELARWRNENDPMMLAIECQAHDHVQALLREEEKGYARGLKDYTALLAAAQGLAVALWNSWQIMGIQPLDTPGRKISDESKDALDAWKAVQP